jgi:hypothetical protein
MSDNVTVIFEPEETPLPERKKAAASSPILYLEYIENKQKVKKEEIGKDYVIDSDSEDERLSNYKGQLQPRDAHENDLEADHEAHEDDLEADLEDYRKDSHKNDPEEDPKDHYKNHLEDCNENDHREDHLEDRNKDNHLDDHKDDHREDHEDPYKPQRSDTQPSLSELKRESKAKVRSNDYKYPLEEENEVTKKRNKVFFHYEVLKRMHPEAQIPEFTSYSDPDQMEEKYELLAKKYSLDSSVENWKRYIIVGILGFEIVLGKLNFDMEGFAQHQISSINTYDQLLIEMAEKSYIPTSERWPVEMRLIMMFTMNVVIFLVSKMIMKQTGVNLIGTINKATGISNELRDHPPPSSSLKDPED